MPLYEYRCLKCNKRFAFLVGMVANAGTPQCPTCQSHELTKLISRVARHRSDEALLEDLADPTKIGDIEDPRNLRRWARKMGRELGAESGEDFSSEMEEMIEAEARGELEEGGSADDTIY